MYLNNGSFKSEVDPHQFNLRERKKIFKSWQVCDWLAKWLIVLGFMDLRWPRVYRRSNVGLVRFGRVTLYRIIDLGHCWLTLYVLNFCRGSINIYMYLHFVLFLHIDTTQVVEILPQIRQEPTYST